MAQDSNGMEVGVPGLGYVKGIKTFDGLLKTLTVGALVFMGVTIWNHDLQGASERATIASKISESAQHQLTKSDQILRELQQQAETQRLQACIAYLSLSAEQRQRTGRTESSVCRN